MAEINIKNTTAGSVPCLDATYTIEDTLGNPLDSGTIPSGGSQTIIINNSTIENTDSSYTGVVLAENNFIVPDSQLNFNTANIGSVVSVKTINVNLSDGTNPITPTSVALTGNDLDINIVPSGVLFKTIEAKQHTSYRTGDEGWRVQNNWYDYTPPINPKAIAELDFSSTNFFNVLKNPLTVNGISNTTRFVDVDGGQAFSSTNNKNLVVIDKLTGLMYTRILGLLLSWNDTIDSALSYSIVVGGTTFDDWYLASELEYCNIYHQYAGISPEFDTLTNIRLLNDRGNQWTSTTYANTTTSAKFFELSVRNLTNLSKITTLQGHTYVMNVRNLITAP